MNISDVELPLKRPHFSSSYFESWTRLPVPNEKETTESVLRGQSRFNDDTKRCQNSIQKPV